MSEPVNLNEVKAMSSKDPEDWTPRDALVKTLRDLDDGVIEAEHLIIVYGGYSGKTTVYGYTQAGNFRPYEQLGLLQTVADTFLKETL